jgi:hypothetical protein
MGWGDDVPPVPLRGEDKPTTMTMPAAVRAELDRLIHGPMNADRISPKFPPVAALVGRDK